MSKISSLSCIHIFNSTKINNLILQNINMGLYVQKSDVVADLRLHRCNSFKNLSSLFLPFINKISIFILKKGRKFRLLLDFISSYRHICCLNHLSESSSLFYVYMWVYVFVKFSTLFLECYID